MLSYLLRSAEEQAVTPAHADKRAVATDALETLGTIIGPEQKRDAIHLAVEPVIAGEDLMPGQDVGFDSPGVAVGGVYPTVGIVDPFIKGLIRTGQRFWLVVYPRQITSLRHVWTHPDFPEEPAAPAPAGVLGAAVMAEEQKRRSEAWLRSFTEQRKFLNYDTLWETVMEDGYHDGVSVRLGQQASGPIPHEFWDHLGIVHDAEIPACKRARYFSCAC